MHIMSTHIKSTYKMCFIKHLYGEWMTGANVVVWGGSLAITPGPQVCLRPFMGPELFRQPLLAMDGKRRFGSHR